jgi:hypothetical protein
MMIGEFLIVVPNTTNTRDDTNPSNLSVGHVLKRPRIESQTTQFFFERKPWGNTPRQQEKYIKRGGKVTRKRDLQPAQPEIRQREGTKQREKQQKRLQGLGREGRGQLSNTATNYRALSHNLIGG